MIAFVIRLFTSIFGDTWYAIELCSQSLSLLTIIFLFLLSKELFGWEAALLSVIILESMPMFFIGSTILTIDAPLIAFWVMTAYLFSKGIREEKKVFLLLSGVTLGLCLMSKYTAILLPAGIFLYLIFSPAHRNLLKRNETYLSFIIGLIVFSPVIIWNIQHDWFSFKYQIGKGLTGGEKGGQFFFFIGSQFVILGPTLFLFFLYSIYRGFKNYRDSNNLYLTVLSAFPFFFFSFASLRSKYTDVSWSDVALIVGVMLMSKTLLEVCRGMSIRKRFSIYLILFMPGFLISAVIAAHAMKPFPFIPQHLDKSLEMYGWDEMGKKVEDAFKKYFPDEKKRFVISKEYQMAGALSFYTASHPVPYSFNKSERNIWVKTEDFAKGSALMVCAEKDCNETVGYAEKIFNEVKEVELFEIKRRGKVVRVVKIYICRRTILKAIKK